MCIIVSALEQVYEIASSWAVAVCAAYIKTSKGCTMLRIVEVVSHVDPYIRMK
jgi:hypothetical protein